MSKTESWGCSLLQGVCWVKGAVRELRAGRRLFFSSKHVAAAGFVAVQVLLLSVRMWRDKAGGSWMCFMGWRRTDCFFELTWPGLDETPSRAVRERSTEG